MNKKAPLQMVWSKEEKDWLFHWDRSINDGSMLNLFAIAGMREIAKLHPDYPHTKEYIDDEKVFELFRDELRRRGFDPDTFKISLNR